MDFYFVLLATFLILDAVSIQCAEEANSNQVQLSAGISKNPFLSPANVNKSAVNPLSRNFVATHISPIGFATPPHTYSGNNPFLNTVSNVSPLSYTPGNSRPSLRDPWILNPVRRISELKCKEYVSEIASTIFVTTLIDIYSDRSIVKNICPNANRLVNDGEDPYPDEFPHMVALGRSNTSFSFICGGTLISHTWVMSAAHCTYGPYGGVTHARVGVFQLSSNEGITIAIKQSIRHPDYKPPTKYADIAVIQLVDRVSFTPVVRPACLPQAYDTVPRRAWVTGWGAKEFSEDSSDKLQKVQLDLIDNYNCTLRLNSSFDIPYNITPAMLCAHNWHKNCPGNFDGPLQVTLHENECLFQVIGITSFGVTCAQIDAPGVYTRVSHYIPWIESQVWPQH